jgi:hypothetical protein
MSCKVAKIICKATHHVHLAFAFGFHNQAEKKKGRQQLPIRVVKKKKNNFQSECWVGLVQSCQTEAAAGSKTTPTSSW